MKLDKIWKNPLVWVLIAAMLIVAVFTRFYALAWAPAGSDADTAWLSIDAANWVNRGVWPYYLDVLHSPDPLIVYLIGISQFLFGVSIATAR